MQPHELQLLLQSKFLYRVNNTLKFHKMERFARKFVMIQHNCNGMIRCINNKKSPSYP